MLILMHARVLNEEPLVLRGAEIAATGKLADPQSLLCYDGNDSPGGLSAGAADEVPWRRRDIGVELTGVCFPCRVSAVLHPPSLQQQPGQGGGRKQHHAAALPGNKKKRPKISYSPERRTFILPAGVFLFTDRKVQCVKLFSYWGVNISIIWFCDFVEV